MTNPDRAYTGNNNNVSLCRCRRGYDLPMSTETTEWCAGIPLVERRPLEEEERQALRLEARSLLRRGLAALLAFPAAVLLLTLLLVALDSASSLIRASVFSAALLTLFCFPVLALVARDSFRRGRGLNRDLREGCVKRFEGPPRMDETDETLSTLRKARVAPALDDPLWRLEVLPGSGRVWSVQGERPARWITARWTEVAGTPTFAAMAAEWLEPVAKDGDTTLLGGRRDLTQAEREEVRRHARRLWVRPLPYVVGLTVWLSLPVAVILRDGRLHSGHDWFSFCLLGAITLWTDVRFARAAWIARGLGADARDGWTIILRRQDPAPSEVAEAVGLQEIAAAIAARPEVVEALPHSRWIWTEDNRPAAWRTAG